MALRLAEPPPVYPDRRRRHISHPKCRYGLRFKHTIAPSRTTGDAYSEAELIIRDALNQLNLKWDCEDVAIRFVKANRKNGQLGWKVFDFRVGAVFIEVSMDENAEKKAAINFIWDRYHLAVVHITPDLVETIAKDPEILQALINEAELLQTTSGASEFYQDILAAAATTATWRAKRAGKRRACTERKRKRERKHEARANRPPNRTDTTSPTLTVTIVCEFSNDLA